MSQMFTPHSTWMTLEQLSELNRLSDELSAPILLLWGWTKTTSTRPSALRLRTPPDTSRDAAGHGMIRYRGRQRPKKGVKTPLKPPASYFSPSNRLYLGTQPRYWNLCSDYEHPSVYRNCTLCGRRNRTQTYYTLYPTTGTSHYRLFGIPYRTHKKTEQKGFDSEQPRQIRPRDPGRQDGYPRSSLMIRFRLPMVLRKKVIKSKQTKRAEHKDQTTRTGSASSYPIDANRADPWTPNPSISPIPSPIRTLADEDRARVLHVLAEDVIYPAKREDRRVYTIPLDLDTTSPRIATKRSKLRTQITSSHPLEPLSPPSPLSTQRSQLVTAANDSITSSNSIVEHRVKRQRLEESGNSETDTREPISHSRANMTAAGAYTDLTAIPEAHYEDSLALYCVIDDAVSPSSTNSRPQSYDEVSRAARCLYYDKAHALREIPRPHQTCKYLNHYHIPVGHPDFINPDIHGIPPIIPAAQLSPFRSLSPSDSVRSHVSALTLPSFPQKLPILYSTSRTYLERAQVFSTRSQSPLYDPVSTHQFVIENLFTTRSRATRRSTERDAPGLVRGLCHDHVTCDEESEEVRA
ncbi:hypothetical protein EDB87DRAFT_1654479 [Lactarius vividus]|nr:hypothetical protein EDB87DRAFT_1654479 [Lactarius vividus]